MNEWIRKCSSLGKSPNMNSWWRLPLTNCLVVAISLYGFFMIRTHSGQHMQFIKCDVCDNSSWCAMGDKDRKMWLLPKKTASVSRELSQWLIWGLGSDPKGGEGDYSAHTAEVAHAGLELSRVHGSGHWLLMPLLQVHRCTVDNEQSTTFKLRKLPRILESAQNAEA